MLSRFDTILERDVSAKTLRKLKIDIKVAHVLCKWRTNFSSKG